MNPLHSEMADIVRKIDQSLLALVPYVQQKRGLMIQIRTSDHYGIPPCVAIVRQNRLIEYDPNIMLIVNVNNYLFQIKIAQLKNNASMPRFLNNYYYRVEFLL